MQEAFNRQKSRTIKTARLMCAVIVLVLVAISTVSATIGPPRTATAVASIHIDKNSYIAGQALTISGEGFSALESVMLRVAHSDGSGFAPWWVYADATGAFSCTWTLPSGDVGANYIVTASGSSGETAQAAFTRKASMTMVRAGSALQVQAEGFNANEPVTVQLSDNSASATFVSDSEGRISGTLEVASPQVSTSPMTATAVSTASFVAASVTTIPSGFFAVLDQQGPNDPGVQDQSDLTQMARDNTDPSLYKLFWSWDSTAQWVSSGNTGDACALFDSDGDGNINYAVCVEIANVGGNPLVVAQTSISPTAWTCSDAKNDRCTQPTARPIVVSGVTQVKAGPLGNVSNSSGNLITDTDPFSPVGSNYPNDSTIEVDILKSYVPNSVLVNVCSYPSAGNGGNNNPFDCIVAPGGGFLRIAKDAGGATDPFTFTVSPIPSGQSPTVPVNGGSTSLPIGVANGSGAKGETITETVPANWTLTGASCKLEDGITSTGTFDASSHAISAITIESGKTTTCTFVNSKLSGTLKVIKHVDSTYGGSKVAADFTYSLGDGSAVTADSGSETGKTYTRNAGSSYNVTENGVPLAGYTTTYSSDCSGTISATTPKTCTITNTAQAAHLKIVKVMKNDNGGNKAAGDFSGTITGVTAIGGNTWTGTASPGVDKTLSSVGSYNIAENDPTPLGYTVSYSPECSGTIVLGQTITCTITNDDVAPKLTVTKTVVNNDGGTKQVSDFALSVNGTSVTSGVAKEFAANVLLTASEVNLSGYAPSSWGGDCAANGTITLKPGDNKTCTITNDDIRPKLTVTKVVKNDHGGTKQVSDFPLSVGGTSVTSGVQTGFSAGTYVVSEVNNFTSDYSGVITGDCASDGTITLSAGDVKSCTITNTEKKGTPSGTTFQSWLVHDTVTVSGLKGTQGTSAGSIVFTLYSDAACTTGAVGSNTVSMIIGSGGGSTVATNTGVAVTSPGTYYWGIHYAGDANNDGFDLCNESTQIVAKDAKNP